MALGCQAAAWLSVDARAQSGSSLPRVAIVQSGRDGDPQAKEAAEAVRAGLEALGWQDGRTIHIDYHWLADVSEAPKLAAKVISQSPTVIMASGTVNVGALHASKTTIPVVFVNVADPVAGGFVSSLARPGGTITGIAPFEYEMGGKWLQLLRDMAPGLRRVVLLGDPANPNFKGFQKPFEAYARTIGIEPIPVAVRTAEDIDRGLRSLATEPGGGLIVTAAAFSVVHRDLIVRLADALKIPAVYWNRATVDRGGLMSYGPDIVDTNRQAATYLDRILKGAHPADLAVQSPVKIELIINGKTARALGLTVPLSLLSIADEVID
jgi:putative ABC transport system substrate-binding protein